MEREQASRLVRALFESFGPTLYRYARQLTGSREAADDLVQEAFMAYYRELRDGTAIANPRAWTMTVVRYQAGKLHRWRRARAEDLMPPESFDGMEAPAGTAREDPDDARLQHLFSLLSEREAEVVTLRMQSMKYREIGAALGISGKAVATLLARALRKMQMAVKAGLGSGPAELGRDAKSDQTLQ